MMKNPNDVKTNGKVTPQAEPYQNQPPEVPPNPSQEEEEDLDELWRDIGGEG